MRILVVSQYYYPEQFRINDICEELVCRGHAVTVLTGFPNYPEGEIFEEYRDRKQKHECINGVDIIRCNMRPRHKGAVNLIRNYVSYVYHAGKKVSKLTGPYDIVFVYGLSPVFMGFPAIRAKKKFDIPMAIYCCDIWPESVRDVLKSTNSVPFRIVKSISSHIYRSADAVICKCPSFVDYLHTVCNVNKDRMPVIYEHAEDTYLQVAEAPVANEVVDFMFLGNIGKSQDCDVIIKAVAKLDPSLPFKMHFVGDGSFLEELKQLTMEYHLEEKVIFHGRYPVAEIVNFYNLADVCVLTLSNDSAIGLTVPAKLTGYLAASRPIVAAISGDASEVIADAACGYCVKAGDADGLSSAMLQCIEKQDVLQPMGNSGRKYFLQHFTKNAFMDQFIKELEKMIEKHNQERKRK